MQCNKSQKMVVMKKKKSELDLQKKIISMEIQLKEITKLLNNKK